MSVKAPAVWRLLAHGMGSSVIVVSRPGIPPELPDIAVKAVSDVAPGPGGVFPLGLRGQTVTAVACPLVQATDECLNVLPGYPFHRIATALGPAGVAPQPLIAKAHSLWAI
jgi:hypothetical protein